MIIPTVDTVFTNILAPRRNLGVPDGSPFTHDYHVGTWYTLLARRSGTQVAFSMSRTT